MQIDTIIIRYDSGGGHRSLSFAGDLLVGFEPPTFGSAVKEIEAYCHIDDPTVPSKMQRSLHTQYRARVKKMPFGTFYRKPKRIELAFHSTLRGGKGLLRYDPRPASRTDVPKVRLVYREVATALHVIRRSVKRSDDFDVDGFLSHIESRVAELDAAPACEIVELLNAHRAAESKRVAGSRTIE